MSIATLIEEARNQDRYEFSDEGRAGVLVIFPGKTLDPAKSTDIRLTLEWDNPSERWRGTASDETRSAECLPAPGEGSDVAAVTGALNRYLDMVNGPSKPTPADRVLAYTQR